jgi:hypothetical protein
VEEAYREVESDVELVLEAFWVEDQVAISIPELVEGQTHHIPSVEEGP